MADGTTRGAGSGCDRPGCCGDSRGVQGSRRAFLQVVGLGTVAAASGLGRAGAMAGPFQQSDFQGLVPADKKLDAAWVESLFARGEAAVYTGAQLERIGMPVGGIGAGQVYLGGDGKLWHWDIFNQHVNSGSGGPHYEHPMMPESPFEQGFALVIGGPEGKRARPLDHRGWRDIAFRGTYPIGTVTYRDPDSPVQVELEAFSPFIPLDVEESSLPCTILSYTVHNGGSEPVELELAGWVENPVGLHSLSRRSLRRVNRVERAGNLLLLECTAEEDTSVRRPEPREDVVVDDFERPDHGGWTVEGTAFGSGPVATSAILDYQGDVGAHGERLINTHASAPGGDVGARDSATGTLTGPAFRIERDFLRMLIGGGSHAGKTCVNLLVEGKVVLSATGRNDNRMSPVVWNVQRWAGQEARLQAVDAESGAWGNIGLDQVVQTDRPEAVSGPLAEESDFGTLVLGMLEATAADQGTAERTAESVGAVRDPLRVRGVLSRPLRLGAGESATVRFVLAWHFPNLKLSPDHGLVGRHYAKRFDSARAVARHVEAHHERLAGQTRLWRDTWYAGTLPYWLLDRALLNASILATSTCFRLGDGRFYGWEGVGCCPGTCGHVWSYAHSVARLFPELERDTRQRVDFGLAMQPDGAIFFRGEFNDFPAVDGQAGTILRALREHQMSAGDGWLKANWSGVRRAIEWLIAKDADGDGLITSNQHNTLDTDWFGPVAWLSGLYLAALAAGAEMATVAGDEAFAGRCREILAAGQPRLVEQLFDGEYFINKPDPARPETINSGSGCEIDQVFGQSWAFQVGLPRVLPEEPTRKALAALWRYNFTPDVGPYRAVNKPGRWYAMPGEAGLLMCTFPRTDWGYDQAKGRGPDFAAGYFNECMNGFEYQVAGHMIWEGMVLEGLAVARAVHDRYAPQRRNPWNEIECGDHYARSMASHGVYLAACGYRYDGPRGRLAFAPRIRPEEFSTAFTGAEGWGTYRQSRGPEKLSAGVEVASGRLRLNELGVELAEGHAPRGVTARVGDRVVPARLEREGTAARVRFENELSLEPGAALEVEIV